MNKNYLLKYSSVVLRCLVHREWNLKRQKCDFVLSGNKEVLVSQHRPIFFLCNETMYTESRFTSKYPLWSWDTGKPNVNGCWSKTQRSFLLPRFLLQISRRPFVRFVPFAFFLQKYISISPCSWMFFTRYNRLQSPYISGCYFSVE